MWDFTPRFCIYSVFTLNAIRLYVGRVCSNNVPGVVWADYRYKLMSRFPWGGSFETHLASTHEVISGTHTHAHTHTHTPHKYTRACTHTHTSQVHMKSSQIQTHARISGTHTHTTRTLTQTIIIYNGFRSIKIFLF